MSIGTNGYTGTILKVDLSSGNIGYVPTQDYSDLFLGGRGTAARIYWDEVLPNVKAFDPENMLIFMTGPATGVPGFGSRFQVCGKSAITDRFSFSNLGGSWGGHLKYAGFDGVVLTGKSDRPVFLSINNGDIELRDASHLQRDGAFLCEKKLRDELGESVRVLCIGPAGENLVPFATLMAADNSAGAGGLAAVMGSKNLKAIAVKGTNKIDVADKEMLVELRKRIKLESSDYVQITASLLKMTMSTPLDILEKSVCLGCPTGCARAIYKKPNGDEVKFMCQAALFYETRARLFYNEITDVPVKATEACNDYGLDTRAIEAMIMWLNRCYKAGILTDENTGIPVSKIGSHEFIDSLVRAIALREGFGDVLARGTHKAADELGTEARELIKDYITSNGDNEIYGPRIYVGTALLLATEPRLPIHLLHEISVPVLLWIASRAGVESVPINSQTIQTLSKKLYGTELALDFSTYDGKALAVSNIQDREYVKESLILCDFAWPIYFTSSAEDGIADTGLESQIVAAVTGRDTDQAYLNKTGERIFNLQRAILTREGHTGREHDCIDDYNFEIPTKGDFSNPECIVPGKNGEAFSRKGMVVDRESFEKMKSEFYEIRGWDPISGLQTRAKLEELELNDVAEQLESMMLLK